MHRLRWCCLGWCWFSLLLWVRLGVRLRFWLQTGLHHQLAASSSPGSSASPLPFGLLLLPARGFHRGQGLGLGWKTFPPAPRLLFWPQAMATTQSIPAEAPALLPSPAQQCPLATSRGRILGTTFFPQLHAMISCHPNYHLHNPPSISAPQHLHRPSAATTWRSSFPT